MFGLIIMGSRGRAKTVGTGQFYCPRCQATRAYEHKQLARYFTVYFIPVFPIEKQGEYVECQTCHTPFEMGLLQPTGPLRIQALMHDLDAQLKAGHAVQLLVNRLLQAGATREEAAWAVYSAGRGHFAACEHCHTIFEGSLAYCSNCGHQLGPFRGSLE